MTSGSPEARTSMDMKRFAVAGATIILTTGLAVFAIAIAQRDSRESESMLHDDAPAYATQPPEPLTLALGPDSLQAEEPAPPRKTFYAPSLSPSKSSHKTTRRNSTLLLKNHPLSRFPTTLSHFRQLAMIPKSFKRPASNRSTTPMEPARLPLRVS